MSNYKINLNKNLLKISGEITFYNVMNILNLSIAKTKNLKHINIDLKKLNRIDSSILIFIVNYIKNAIEKKQTIIFVNISNLLINLSKIYNLDSMINKINKNKK